MSADYVRVWQEFPSGIQNLLLKVGVITVTTIIKIIVTIILALESKNFTVINAGVGAGSGYTLSKPLSESGGLKTVSPLVISWFPFYKRKMSYLAVHL